MNGRIIAIEGNIGSGKTSLVNILKDKLLVNKNVIHFEEPIDETLLAEYLKNPILLGSTLQLYMLCRRKEVFMKALEYKDKGYIVLLDRSLYGDIAFCKAHLEWKNINKDIYDCYLRIFELIPRKEEMEVYYLDVSVETAISRIRKRNRLSESKAYDVSYLKMIKDKYEESLPHFVKKLDWNHDLESLNDQLNMIIRG